MVRIVFIALFFCFTILSKAQSPNDSLRKTTNKTFKEVIVMIMYS